MVFIAVIFLGFASSASADGLALSPGEVNSGRNAYLKRCGSCHGRDAAGGNSPNIQGYVLKDVLEASAGIENMPEIRLGDQEAAEIATYLMSLAPNEAMTRMR